ncbi:MAG TPA: YceI family protein [Bryobacteraceae bacterium]|nr:YceI family protein [Bryobacteraceae bacterium]
MTYQIDPQHTAAQFKVRHMMIANVKGEFDKVTGAVEFDPSNLSLSRVDACIDVNSISTRESQRDEHLKSADFLEAAKYPRIDFRSQSVSANGGGYKVAGDLTIRGVTKPVILTVSEVTEEVKDPWGLLRRGATASTRISRADFGLTFNVALETGGVLVGDHVDITLDVEMTRKPE